MNLKKIILDFLFPNFCISCQTQGLTICNNCFASIPISPKDKNNILSVYEYRHPIVNRLLWKLKYHHSNDIAMNFGKPIALAIKNWLADFDNSQKIILIPIPLNYQDKRIHNHASLLANSIKNSLDCDPKFKTEVWENFLIKKTHKKQAHTIGKRERIKNVENTIWINPKSKILENFASYNRKQNLYILVDDVSTTGSTILNAKFRIAEYFEISQESILGVVVAH